MPNRKKWVPLVALVLFLIGISGFFKFGLSLTFIMWGTAFLLFVWDNQTDKHEKQEIKRAYISNFSPEVLCCNIANLNLVYKIIEKNEDVYKLQLVWSGENPVHDGAIKDFPTNQVMPFDKDLFLGLT